jgi:hypothetical protein
MINAETIRLAHDRLRAAGVNEEYLVKPALRTSLEGLPIRDRDRFALEAKVRQWVMRQNEPNLDKYDVEPDPGKGRPYHPPENTGTITQALPGDSCLCVSGFMSMPGTEQYWSSIDPVPAPPPGSTVSHFWIPLFIDNFYGTVFSGDSLILGVEDGAAYGLSPDDMHVGLATHRTVTWAKEIYAWQPCRGRLAAVTVPANSRSATYMFLKRGCNGPDTIVFTKPQWWGIWADVGHYRISRFWKQFGGKRLTFTWMTE